MDKFCFQKHQELPLVQPCYYSLKCFVSMRHFSLALIWNSSLHKYSSTVFIFLLRIVFPFIVAHRLLSRYLSVCNNYMFDQNDGTCTSGRSVVLSLCNIQ